MFLQTGLGLTRQQWDTNFYAFDYGGAELRRQENLPWMRFDPNSWSFSSREIPQEIWRHWTPIPNDGSHIAYLGAPLNCYIWGFRPPDVAETPLFGVRGLFGVGALPGPFNICRGGLTCPSCPPCATCPTCPPPLDCPPSPECAVAPIGAPKKFGVNIGLLVAGALTVGVGYYGYRKGWFRRRG